MNTITGRCLCNKTQYTITSPPISQGVCFCLQCQKAGSLYGSPLMVLSKDSFDCSNETMGSYKTISNRGSIVTRNFCKECGTHIFSQISDVPEIVTVKSATLDNLNLFAPQYAVWIQSASSKISLPTGLPLFQENAPIEFLIGKKT